MGDTLPHPRPAVWLQHINREGQSEMLDPTPTEDMREAACQIAGALAAATDMLAAAGQGGGADVYDNGTYVVSVYRGPSREAVLAAARGLDHVRLFRMHDLAYPGTTPLKLDLED